MLRQAQRTGHIDLFGYSLSGKKKVSRPNPPRQKEEEGEGVDATPCGFYYFSQEVFTSTCRYLYAYPLDTFWQRFRENRLL